MYSFHTRSVHFLVVAIEKEGFPLSPSPIQTVAVPFILNQAQLSPREEVQRQREIVL